MRKFLIPFAIAALAGTTGAIASDAAKERAPSRIQREQARLLDEIAQLTPQQPLTCIDTRANRASLRAVGSKLVYRVSSKQIYVTETGGGCEQVARGDTLVTRQFGPRLCRGDIATTVDLLSRMPTGSCAMGSFTPYTAR